VSSLGRPRHCAGSGCADHLWPDHLRSAYPDEQCGYIHSDGRLFEEIHGVVDQEVFCIVGIGSSYSALIGIGSSGQWPPLANATIAGFAVKCELHSMAVECNLLILTVHSPFYDARLAPNLNLPLSMS
jgi:hypothetical protein